MLHTERVSSHMLFTIGHSGHSLDHFLWMLREHAVMAVADVRSRPFSRFNPQFNQDVLAGFLRANRIHYVFLGDELGARRSEPECYVDGKAKYELIAQTALFQSGLDRLRRGLSQQSIALMCAEKDPITCHRTILVGRHLRDEIPNIQHIREDGSSESCEAAETRLLDVLKLDAPELFVDREQMIQRAYDAQGEKIAYVRDINVPDEQGVLE